MADPNGFLKVPVGSHAPSHSPEYKSTVKRSPRRPLVIIPHTLSEVTGPAYGHEPVLATDADLTRQSDGEPIGERIIVTGRLLDENGRPVPHSLVEVWQANAAGRYKHPNENHPAPLDPHFYGAGRTVTDADGRYKFVTMKPGAYPWPNHHNAWRPAHIHFSVFGPSFATRLITQMYFPGDPLFQYDPIMGAVRDERARARMVAAFDINITEPDWALGYKFDIVVRGRDATPFGV
jgi:protocatechuate 3,4-dioxygenase, beta subunit